MSDRTVIRVIWGCGIVMLVLGCGMTVGSVRNLDAHRIRLEGKAADMSKLLAFGEELGMYDAARQAFGELADEAPALVADALAAALPGYEMADLRAGSADLAEGWRVHSKEIVLDEVPLPEVMLFVQQMEAGRPPWRLEKIIIKASSQKAGFGRVILSMEALEKGRIAVPES